MTVNSANCDLCASEWMRSCQEHDVHLCSRHWAKHLQEDHRKMRIAPIDPSSAPVPALRERPETPEIPDAPKRVAAMPAPVPTHVPRGTIAVCVGCDRERRVRCRGLCESCVSVARRSVKRGEVTWDDLVKAGIALPGRHRGGAPGAMMLKIRALRAGS